MKRGFYTIMAAQFFSSLADNALLIASIALLMQLNGPAWMTPLLKFFFTVSYVVLAPFVGPFADAWPKGRVMFVTNTVKIVGCLLMLFYETFSSPGLSAYLVVLIAYGIVGLGAAAYSPAKYGILTELLPAEKLVVANGWIEGLTVISIIVGNVFGALLIKPAISTRLLSIDLPYLQTTIDTPAEAAIAAIAIFYVLAAIFNLYIPDTGARYEKQKANPVRLVADFSHCFSTLWRDRLGQITLAVTTLFWGAGATLQFIVLGWSKQNLRLSLDESGVLLGIFGFGTAIGAIVAARVIPLKRSLHVLPAGILMGALVMTMTLVTTTSMAYALIVCIGALAGFFVVPMNALLQHRGHVLLSAGHSIAVQNFNENLCILVMLALYAALLRFDSSINTIILLFGQFVVMSMFLVGYRYLYNKREHDMEQMIGEEKRR